MKPTLANHEVRLSAAEKEIDKMKENQASIMTQLQTLQGALGTVQTAISTVNLEIAKWGVGLDVFLKTLKGVISVGSGIGAFVGIIYTCRMLGWM